MALSCFRSKKRAERNEFVVLTSMHEISSSIVTSTSGINTTPPNINFVKNLVTQLADELYALARKKIGGTVIMYHLCEDTADWHATKETFISPPKAFNHTYKPGVLKKIFIGAEHDGAVICYLCNGLIDSVSTKLFMVKHDCENKCASRGTRHSSACSFCNFTPVPIIVISEEKGDISFFWNGRVQFGIDKEDLKMELLKAYVTQEDSCAAYTILDDQHFSKHFNINPIPNISLILSDTWFHECYWMNQMDLHKGASFTLDERILPGKEERIITPKYREHDTLVEKCIEYNIGDDLASYYSNEKQCLNLNHGGKPLGGFFYRIVGKTIVFGNFFLLRQLLHGGLAAYFLKEVFWKKIHSYCDTMEFLVPDHLEEPLANMIEALSDTEESTLRVKCSILNSAATVIINAQINPDLMLYNTLSNWTDLNNPYSPEGLAAIFQNKNSPVHDGSVFINLHSTRINDEPAIYSAGNKLYMDSQDNWENVASISQLSPLVDKSTGLLQLQEEM